MFHAFCTTVSRKDRGPGSPSVRVATSRDLTKWTKEAGPPLLLLKRDVPAVGTYSTFANWRDPHVFWDPWPVVGFDYARVPETGWTEIVTDSSLVHYTATFSSSLLWRPLSSRIPSSDG